MQRIAAARDGITAVVGFIDFDRRRTQRQRHDPQVQRRRRRPRRARAAAGAQVASAQLPLFRRQALLYARRAVASRSTSTLAGAARCAWASRSAKTCGTSSTTSSRCPELAAKGADVLLNINASPFYPGKRARSATRSSAGTSRSCASRSSTSTPSGAADNGKNIIPFDGESLVYDADGRLLAIGPAVRRGAADRRHRRGAGRTACSCRPSIASARSTTRW